MNMATSQTSITAVLSLVFGILTWIALPLVGAVVAVVTGHVARGEIRRAQGALDGDGMAIAGLILGWAQLLLCVLALLAFLLFFGGLAVLASLAH